MSQRSEEDLALLKKAKELDIAGSLESLRELCAWVVSRELVVKKVSRSKKRGDNQMELFKTT